MDDFFYSLLDPSSAPKPLVSATYMTVSTQQSTAEGMVGLVLERLKYATEGGAVDNLAALAYITTTKAVSPDSVDAMLDTVLKFGIAHGSWCSVSKWVCALLKRHCNNDLTISQIAEEGAVDYALSAIQQFGSDPQVCASALALLSHFNFFSLGNVMTHISQTLERHGSICAVAVHAARAAAEFTTYWGGSQDTVAQMCNDFVAANGVQWLVAAMRGSPTSEELNSVGCRLLINICSSPNEAHPNEVAQKGGAVFVFNALTTYAEDMSMLPHALHALAALTASPEVHQSNSAEAIVTILKNKADSEVVQTEAIRALSCFAMHAKETKPNMAAKGCVQAVIAAMKRFAENQQLQQESCNLLSYLSFDSEALTASITHLGGIPLVIAALVKFKESQTLHMAACAALSGLTFNNSIGQRIVGEHGGISVILDVMRRGSKARVQEMGCLALGTMCWNVELKAEVVRLGGIEVILKALLEHFEHAGLVKNACRALAQIAFNSERYREEMSAHGAIPLIIKAMAQHPYHDRAQMHACVALSYLSWTCEQNAAEIASHDGYRVVIQAMKNHPNNHEVQEHACRALANISSVTLVGADQALDYILEAMRRHERVAEVQEEACRAIVTLALASAENKEKLSTKSAVERVIAALHNFPKNALVQQEACNALAHLAYEHQALNMSVTKGGGVAVLLEAMRSHPMNPKVQLNACGGLSALAFDNAVAQRQIFDQDGVGLVISAMNEFDRVRMIELGCSVLGTLAWNPEIKDRVAVAALPEILRVMKFYHDNSLLQKSACRALSQFAYNSEANRKILVEKGAVELVIKSINAHMQHDKLIAHAIVALTYLCWESTDVAHSIVDAGGLIAVQRVLDTYLSNDRVFNKATHLVKILTRQTGAAPVSPVRSGANSPLPQASGTVSPLPLDPGSPLRSDSPQPPAMSPHPSPPPSPGRYPRFDDDYGSRGRFNKQGGKPFSKPAEGNAVGSNTGAPSPVGVGSSESRGNAWFNRGGHRGGDSRGGNRGGRGRGGWDHDDREGDHPRGRGRGGYNTNSNNNSTGNDRRRGGSNDQQRADRAPESRGNNDRQERPQQQDQQKPRQGGQQRGRGGNHSNNNNNSNDRGGRSRH